MATAGAELLREHLTACATQLSWCLVPHQLPLADLALLARAMLADAARAFDIPASELPAASQLLAEAEALVVWRGEVDASERAEWQHQRIQDCWAELLRFRELAE